MRAKKIITNLLFDIEGTLTGINGRGHSENLYKYLKIAMENNIKIGLITGRESAIAKAIHRIFDLNGPIISENGAVIFIDYKNDERNFVNIGGIEPSDYKDIIDILKDNSILKRMYIDKEKEVIITLYLNEFPNHRLEDLIENYKIITKIIENKFVNISVTHSSAAVDINTVGVNKGTGIKEFVNRSSVEISSIGFIGDSLNDKPAFEFVLENGGIAGMVGDDPSLEKFLEKYDRIYISKNKGSDGSVEFLKHILSNNIVL